MEENTIVNSGGEEGVAIDVRGQTKDVRLLMNVIREERGTAQRTGIRLGEQTQRITVDGNQISGVRNGVVDLRASG